jgi:uncharacterized protein (TIGR02996 family)
MANLAQELLAAVLAAPDDDAPRLVYADHLQQQGDLHGELIAIQCSLARGGLSKLDRVRLQERGTTLATAYKATLPKAGTFDLRRGFAHAWSVDWSTFSTVASAVFARHPIRVLDLRHPAGREPPAMAKALERPELARIRRLELRRLWLTAEDIQLIVSCAHLADLRELELGSGAVVRDNLHLLTAKPVFTRLEALSFTGVPLNKPLLDAVKLAPFIGTLRSLALKDVRVMLSEKSIAEFARNHPRVAFDLINTTAG